MKDNDNVVLSGMYSNIIESIRNINDTDMVYDDNYDISVNIVEKQKVYLWIRLYLKEEIEDINIGDDFTIKYIPNGDEIVAKFIAYGKKNLNRDLDNMIINYDPEDNRKCLCLMVDEEDISSDKTKFIRTLFKTSKFYQFQVYRRTDLIFTNIRTNSSVDYIECDF